jgi:hypothetical protein
MAQNSFAYVGAINGSVGCALLLFVIPCAIDLKLHAHQTVMMIMMIMTMMMRTIATASTAANSQ